METSNKRKFWLWIILIIALSWFFGKYLLTPVSISTGFIKFVPILPSETFKNEGTKLPFRRDFFSILNLNRSDSSALLHSIIRHVCQVTDTIALGQYELYTIEYYEHSQYMNDSTPHRRDRPLFHLADELDAFVYGVSFGRGKLYEIEWYKTGKRSSIRNISITAEVKQLFEKCHKK